MAILIRPVREQLEHDRVIRLLQAKYKRKFDAAVNVGDERLTSIKVGPVVLFPDLVLTSPHPPRKVVGVVEVETGESVNHLEAMAQWANLGKSRAAFHLYVPSSSFDIARRLCDDMQIQCAELWTYMLIGDQLRFTLARKSAGPEPAGRPEAPRTGAKAAPKAAGAKAAAAKKSAARVAKAGKAAKPAKSTKPARSAGKAAKATGRAKPAARPAAKAPAKKAARSAARGSTTRSAKRR